MWPLCKTLASHIHSSKSCALKTIKKVYWSNLVPNGELHQRTSQLSILYIMLSTVFDDWVMSYDNLMNILPVQSRR